MRNLIRLQNKGKGKRKPQKVIVRKVTAVLNWTGSYFEKIYKAKVIKKKMTNNTRYPLPWPTDVTSLADLGTHIVDFDNGITAEAAGEITTEALDILSEIVHADLISIMGMVQDAMEADIENARVIAEDAGFETNSDGTRGPRKAQCFQSTEQGALIVWGNGGGPHEWQKSLDGGATFVNYASTTSGILEERNQKSDVALWFRSRQVLKGGTYGPWSIWVSGIPL